MESSSKSNPNKVFLLPFRPFKYPMHINELKKKILKALRMQLFFWENTWLT